MRVHLALLFIILFLNLIPEKRINRKKYILPLSFLLILAYWALRYDYGLDYWNYYQGFTEGQTEKNWGFGERWFYMFANLFPYYYQFIIAHSLIVVVSLFHLVRKYIPTNCYWLFFFLLFCIPGLHYNLISAMRSTLAACILYWSFDWFYISRRRWLPFIASVFVATMFHTSAIVFLSLPFVHYSLDKINGRMIFALLVVADLLSMFYVNQLFEWAISQSSLTEGYDYYSETLQNFNFFGLLGKSVILFPTYYICTWYDKQKSDTIFRCVSILAFLGLFINMLGLNFQGRFTVYLYPFVIIAMALTCQYVKKNTRIIMLVPYSLSVIYFLVNYFNILLANITGRWAAGNPYFYHTIFDATSFPF